MSIHSYRRVVIGAARVCDREPYHAAKTFRHALRPAPDRDRLDVESWPFIPRSDPVTSHMAT
jgi:hypothetical protein